ncbi:MAG: hypothetical protein ACOC56_00550 [Atribacterota bacterium]
MIIIQTKIFKQAYSSVHDQPTFKDRDMGRQKAIVFDLDKWPDSEDEIKAKWSKNKEKNKKKHKKERN